MILKSWRSDEPENWLRAKEEKVLWFAVISGMKHCVKPIIGPGEEEDQNRRQSGREAEGCGGLKESPHCLSTAHRLWHIHLHTPVCVRCCHRYIECIDNK